MASSTSNVINFNYVVPDENGTYLVRVKIMHQFFGTTSIQQIFTALTGAAALPAMIPTLFPSMLVTGASVIFIMSVPMIFGALHGATAGVIVVLFAALLAYWGWLQISALILIIALAYAILNKLRSGRG